MVYPRAHGKRSLATFVAVCALLALSVAHADSRHDSAALTSDHRATRSLDASVIVVEGDNGMPAVLIDDGMQLTSVITITAVDTPEPVYGTDDNQPTLPPDDDNDSLPPQVNFPDVIETHAPNFEDPFVLIETRAPAGDGDSSDASTLTPCPSTVAPVSMEPKSDVPALGAASTDAPATEGPSGEDPALEAPLTEMPGAGNPTSGATTPGSDAPSTTGVATTATATTDEPPQTTTPQPSDDSATEMPTLAPSSDTPTVTPSSDTPAVTPSSDTPTVTPSSDTPAVVPTPADDLSSSTSAPTPAIADNAQPQAPTLNPRLFGTKTTYWDQRNLFLDDPSVKRLKEKTEQELSELTLLQVQQVTRHGIRFPTKSTIVAIESLLEKLQREYADSIPAWLQSYRLPYNVSVEGALAPPGFTELERFGARTREAIGAALPTVFADGQFILQHTFKSRTKHSALSFAKSFFANPDNVTYIEYAKNKKDRLLRFFDECPRYIGEVSESADAFAELTAYRESATMVQSIEVFKSKLNLSPTADITQGDLEAAYSACSFDIAIYDTYSSWCTLLTKDLAFALDYGDDLETFYEKGPGHAINYEIAAVLLKDVYAFMERLLAGDTNVVGNFRFAHSETTLPLMTLLGYGDRTPLRATYTPDQIACRGFRSSVLAPLGANIDFRLYESKRDSSKHFVQVLVNEKVAPVPGCGGEVFCELSKVAQLWDYYLTKYDFDADCKL